MFLNFCFTTRKWSSVPLQFIIGYSNSKLDFFFFQKQKQCSSLPSGEVRLQPMTDDGSSDEDPHLVFEVKHGSADLELTVDCPLCLKKFPSGQIEVSYFFFCYFLSFL